MVNWFFQSLRMGVENLFRNKVVNLLSLGIIAFTLLIFGLFRIVSTNLNQYISKLTQTVSAIFYIRDGTEAKDIQNLHRQIQQSLLIEKTMWISKEEAQKRFSREFPELKGILSEFDQSPFPASLEVQFKQSPHMLTQSEAFIKEMRQHPWIESIQVNTDWAKRITTFRKLLSVVGIFLSSILIFVTVFIIYNVIRLNILFRRDEISIFQLIGATNTYIRMPFLLEGLILGLTGGILSVLLLIGTIRLFAMYGGNLLNIVRGVVEIHQIPIQILLTLVIMGLCIGFFSSLISLKRFLHTRH